MRKSRSVSARTRARRLRATLLLAAPLAGCMVGPDYRRPTVQTPSRFQELGPPPGWQTASPANAALPKGPWWTIYGDPVLDGLEAQVPVANQTLAQDQANYRQSVALIDEARGQLFPVLSIVPSAQRNGSRSGISIGTTGSSLNSGLGSGLGGTTGTSNIGTPNIFTSNREADRNQYSLQGSISWDLDLWGRIRRQIESNVATAQADAALIANAQLSLEAELATTYFELRSSDSLQSLLDHTVEVYRRNLTILHNQTVAGTAQPSDELQALTQLRQTEATAASVGAARATYQHAIAVLTGQVPSALVISPGALQAYVPQIPAGVPSDLLQRRPDIAEAERQMKAANALIGVQVAAFYPDVSLSATGGYLSPTIGSLIQVANRFWSLGVAASQTLFEGGIRSAAVSAAEDSYDASVANYRATVLAAFQGVEDQLADLRQYGEQIGYQQQAVDAANRAVVIATNEYQAGTQAYTTVVTAEATALGDAQTLLSVQQNRLTSSVSLIEALGGGWTTAEIPDRDSLQRSDPLIPSFLEGRDQRTLPPPEPRATGPLSPR